MYYDLVEDSNYDMVVLIIADKHLIVLAAIIVELQLD